ncbi:MAG: ABC transporter permease [Pedosphaera sp.]|nr:ABC transporter permease [Pedosphaera sp.]
MRAYWIIATNAFMELVRQPVFLLLFTVSSCACLFLALIPYVGFGDDPKLAKDGALAVMFLSGLFGAVVSASSSVAQEIQTGTALAVLSKPVSRLQFILGKYTGLAAGLVVLCYTNTLSVLLAGRMAFDAYGNPDLVGATIFFGGIAIAYLAGGAVNYFLNKPFLPWAVLFTVLAISIGFLLVCCIDKETAWRWVDNRLMENEVITFADLWVFSSDKPDMKFGMGVDWRLFKACVLILFALWILAAVALACSTRLSWMPSLIICSLVFVMGLMSDYLFGKQAMGGTFLKPGELILWHPPVGKEGMFPLMEIKSAGVVDATNRPVSLFAFVSSATNTVAPPALPGTIVVGVTQPLKPIPITFERVRDELQLGRGRGNEGHLSFMVVPSGVGSLEKNNQLVPAGSWWGKMLYVLVPNWQLFWLADALGPDQSIPWKYVGTSLLYVIAYLSVMLCLALVLFEDRELS